MAICTYRRNGPLETLLKALLVNAERLSGKAAVGVVVVDDSSDCDARGVVTSFEGRFELGIHYRVSGRRNISLARNLAIDTAAEVADWVAMTDDDCEPEPNWLEGLMDVQQCTNADAVAGRYRRRAPPGAPSWLTDEPFLDVAISTADPPKGAGVEFAGTNNSLISARWWRNHPGVRFRPDFGVTGGEDVVFYVSAHAAGLRIHAARQAVVLETQPAARTSLKYQLWHFFWLGNSSFVTRRETRQASSLRMLLQAGNHIRRALARPISRMLRGHGPQARYCLASVLFGIGIISGVVGIRVSHH